MSGPLNVVFLSMDAVRFDRTQIGGYGRPTTPTLLRLSDDALVADRAFSLGPFTQSACIQMLTSTKPFSYGGFDFGAKGRPGTVFQAFKNAGYRTTAVSTLHWVNRFMGYGESLDEEYQLFLVTALVGVCVNNIRNSLALYFEGAISSEEMLGHVRPTVARFFDDASEYCRLRLSDGARYKRAFPNSLLVNNRYDYRGILKVIDRHRQRFARDPLGYIRGELNPIPETHAWISAEWKYRREIGKLVSESLFQLSNMLLGLVDPELARNRKYRFKSYVEAHEVSDQVIATIHAAEADKPFFIWAHFMDTHLPYVSGRGPKWYRQTPAILAGLGHDPAISPTASRDGRPKESEFAAFAALYDAAIRTVDEEIGRIVEALEASGHSDDTLIVVCSDHGEEFGEHGGHAHQFTFYEHNVRVPLLFYRKGMGTRSTEGLATLLDIAPTICALAGIEPNPMWEGVSLAGGASGSDHVMMETFFGGNCLFEHRPLYFGIRTETHKYIWMDRRDPRDVNSPDGPELYDLLTDPDERRNLYASDNFLVGRFNKLIEQRMSEIPEIPQVRIKAAFPLSSDRPMIAAGDSRT